MISTVMVSMMTIKLNIVDHHDHHAELQYHDGRHDECHGDPHDRHHAHHHLVKSQHNLKTSELARKSAVEINI